MKTNTIHILYTLVDCGESVSDCHTLYSTLEKAKAAMEVEIQEDGQGFTVGIDEQIPQ